MTARTTPPFRADHVGGFLRPKLGQLALLPQCDFSSTVHGNAIATEAQAARLWRVVDVATEVWGSA